MLNKFFNFLKGYVIILLSGKNSERFVNICLRRTIPVWGLKRRENGMEICMYMKDFKRLRDIRRKTRVRVSIIKKVSIIKTMLRYKKRCVFLLCAILCAAAVYSCFNHIWAVEINGVRNTDIERIAALLEENGVYVGASKSELKETGEIRNNVLANYEELAWMWVYMEGSKARVEVFERRIPPQIVDRNLASDIVSVCDGVIKKVTVKLGEPCVNEGDAVSAGDVLITGRVRAYQEGEEERYLDVHSLGEVLAYTMHTASREEKLYDEIRTPTGRKKRYVTVELFGKKYELFKEKKTEYADYDIKTNSYELTLPFLGYMGIAVNVETDAEVKTEKSEISTELATARARDALEEQIAKELTPLSERTDERLEYDYIDSETIIVKCTMSFIENIGTEQAR